LAYDRNRYYDPNSGRFTQEDPIGLAGGLNLYGYAGGDPANNSDPFGLCPACAVAEAGAEVGTLILPGPGTVVGAVVGGVIGAVGGHYLGKWLAGKLNSDDKPAVPEVDGTGKVHGALPGHVPEEWTAEDLEHAGRALDQSIKTRKDEQERLGEDGPHRERIRQEERLRKQIDKKQNGS
jgi:hypothetical protein